MENLLYGKHKSFKEWYYSKERAIREQERLVERLADIVRVKIHNHQRDHNMYAPNNDDLFWLQYHTKKLKRMYKMD
jgi:hypothetical protein